MNLNIQLKLNKYHKVNMSEGYYKFMRSNTNNTNNTNNVEHENKNRAPMDNISERKMNRVLDELCNDDNNEDMGDLTDTNYETDESTSTEYSNNGNSYCKYNK